MTAPLPLSLLLTYTTSAVALLAIGCENAKEKAEAPATPPPPSAHFKVKTLIDRMRDADPKVREAAGRQLVGMAGAGFAPKDGNRLLLAAAEPAAKGLDALPTSLVHAAGINPSPDAVPMVEELYAKFGDPAKLEALELLANLPGRPAAEAYMRLLAKSQGLDRLPVGSLAREPRHPDVFFPALLDLAKSSVMLPDACEVAAAFAEEGLLTTETLRPHADPLAELLDAKVELLEGHGLYQPTPEVEEGWRKLACRLLDLLAYAPSPRIAEVSQRALTLDDSRVKAHAMISLLKQGEMIDAQTAERVASNAGVRLWLRVQLQDLDRFDLFPERFRTQEATAEGELAAWLATPGALGREPLSLEYSGTQTAWTSQGPARQFYLFKFQAPQDDPRSQKGWMAAWVSYPPHVQPLPATGGLCGTSFMPWPDLSPEGHITRAAKLPPGASATGPDEEDD